MAYVWFAYFFTFSPSQIKRWDIQILFLSLEVLKGFILTSVCAHAQTQVQTRPCDGRRWIYAAAKGVRRFDFSFGLRPKNGRWTYATIQEQEQVLMSTYMIPGFPTFGWKPTSPQASGLTLASPRSRRPTLGISHFDVTGDARDRAGLDGTLNLDPSPM